jgi:hypothetical protein
MILSLYFTLVCIGIGMMAAHLASYPLYWGLLAGWLFPSIVLMIIFLPYVAMRRIKQTRRQKSALSDAACPIKPTERSEKVTPNHL